MWRELQNLHTELIELQGIKFTQMFCIVASYDAEESTSLRVTTLVWPTFEYSTVWDHYHQCQINQTDNNNTDSSVNTDFFNSLTQLQTGNPLPQKYPTVKKY